MFSSALRNTRTFCSRSAGTTQKPAPHPQPPPLTEHFTPTLAASAEVQTVAETCLVSGVVFSCLVLEMQIWCLNDLTLFSEHVGVQLSLIDSLMWFSRKCIWTIWGLYVNYMNSIWTVYGLYGLYMECVDYMNCARTVWTMWIVNRLYVNCIWTVYGLYIDCILTLFGLHVLSVDCKDCRWTVCGLNGLYADSMD